MRQQKSRGFENGIKKKKKKKEEKVEEKERKEKGEEKECDARCSHVHRSDLITLTTYCN